MTKQTYIPGTEPTPDPAHDPEISAQVDAWQKAKQEQREAADTTAIRHAKLLELLNDRGVARYPYTDPATGRKRYVVVEAEPKAKLTKPITQKPKDERAAEKRAEKREADEAARVSHRKVDGDEARKKLKITVTAGGETVDVSDVDPFAKVRESMEAQR